VASPSPEPVEIFISYAHEDEGLRALLEKHLANLRDQKVITAWHGRLIRSGDDWSKEISRHLETARIFLLLVSADFMASRYCYGIELKRALERHNAGEARVIPVLLRYVDLEDSPIARLQALPEGGKPVVNWGDRHKAFTNVAKGIRKELNDLDTHRPVKIESPLPGNEITVVTPQDVVGDKTSQPEQPRPRIEKRDPPASNPLTRRTVILAISAMVLVCVLLAVSWLFVHQPPSSPAIQITVIPRSDPEGGPKKNAYIAGTVSGVIPEDFRVVIYSLTTTWYVQPLTENPWTGIRRDGSWSTNIKTGSRYAALLVPKQFPTPDPTTNSPSSLPGVIAATEVEGTAATP
jgi:hypothetical protein